MVERGTHNSYVAGSSPASAIKMPHEEIPIKVTAWVDRGIAPLVEALNKFPDIITVDSCEGRDSQPAHVYFTSRKGREWLANFLCQLSAKLTGCSLRLEWIAGSSEPMAGIFCSRESIDCLSNALNNR